MCKLLCELVLGGKLTTYAFHFYNLIFDLFTGSVYRVYNLIDLTILYEALNDIDFYNETKMKKMKF